MIGVFWDSLRRYASLLGAAVRPPPGRRLPPLRRAVAMLALVPLMTVVQALHWLGFLLDEVLFPGYRRVTVRAPLFVLGVPRSGTTLVHRVLAADPTLTTFRTWECALAPSVTQRVLLLGLARLDRAVGRPFGRLLGMVERAVFRSLDDVHAMDLAAPEEDYLALLPVFACFILVVPFPTADAVWRMATVDRDMPTAERRRLMDFYKKLLQRHLYVHGPGRRLLSKNAAFAGLAGALRETFPDARFLRCHRDPQAVVPSQLSAIQGGVRLFGSDPEGRVFTPRLTAALRFYYENLNRHLPAPGGTHHVCLDMATLKDDLEGAVRRSYEALGLPMDPGFAARLREEAAAARAYRSRHRYAAGDFGLSEAAIAAEFSPVQDHAGCGRPAGAPALVGHRGS